MERGTAEIALAMLDGLRGLTWPDGSEVRVRIGIAEALATRLAPGYELSEQVSVDLKGKGLTPARWLRGRR